MKKSLSLKETILVGSMLFGMFFGAGNLIFPVHMGQLAGKNVWQAAFGFIVTAVGLPILGVTCLGISKKNSLFEVSSLVGDKFKYFFTVLLYLTIGPFFAIPRCAATSFTIGITPLLHSNSNHLIPRLIFTFLFFALILFFALKPNKILNYIGKFINPLFLFFLFILIIVVLIKPMAIINNIAPDKQYSYFPFFKGFIEGYNTMDAIASLAFGITVINVICNLGIKDESKIAINTIKAGVFACILMAIIYILTSYIGAMSIGVFEISENGGDALAEICKYYFGNFGIYLLLIVVTLACFKTALALIVSCSEIFSSMFPKFLSKTKWSVIFTVSSFIISNFGLNLIIAYSFPLLMFLYPITITIIILALIGKLFNYKKQVFSTTVSFAFCFSLLDFINYFPKNSFIPNSIINMSKNITASLPLSNIGLSWLIPVLIGFIFSITLIQKDL